jgi:hypothetical protein
MAQKADAIFSVKDTSQRHSHSSSVSTLSIATSNQSQYLLGQSITSNPITAANQRRYAEYLAGTFNLTVEMVQPAG